MEVTVSSRVDVTFALRGQAVPRDHRRALAAALERRLPWLADPAHAGVHRINAVAGTGPTALLSQRARLTLRVARGRVDDLQCLHGARLELDGHALQLGSQGQVRELVPHGTLYAHLVTTDDEDELAFLATIGRELDAADLPCRPICGRRQVVDNGGHALTGYSLMLDGLSAVDSLRVLESGLGLHRRLGCGLFVPHKSAAAVGA
jgi:CRISPR-associated protein Cas6